MTGESSVRTNRPELVALHGYDTKCALHSLRLRIRGVELLSNGRITLPVPRPHRDYLRAVRHGDIPLTDVVRAVDDAERQLLALSGIRHVPAHPDTA